MRSDLDLVFAHDEIADLDPAARRLALRDILAEGGTEDLGPRVARAADEIDGFGAIAELMRDHAITDILINGAKDVWIERAGSLHKVASSFTSTDHLTAWCERQITCAGGRLDTAHPIADARLSDGSRMHVVLPPLAPSGPLVSIRRFPEGVLSIDALLASGTMTDEERVTLEDAVRHGRSIVISGPTGSGKTTLLNALLALVPVEERVVVIEELPELKLTEGNRVSLVTRTANAEGRGAVGLEELVRASLRMRPDRIIVGEVRGSEALPALWAMRTGHAGSMLSLHADSASEAAARLADLALSAHRAPPPEVIARDIASAVDVYVHMDRRGGRRVLSELVLSR